MDTEAEIANLQAALTTARELTALAKADASRFLEERNAAHARETDRRAMMETMRKTMDQQTEAMNEMIDAAQAQQAGHAAMREDYDRTKLACCEAENRITELEKVIRELRDAKGRHNSGVAYARLVAALEK